MAEDGYKVTLNVYDLSQGLARQLSMTFLGKSIEGIWHTGLVVYGNEYFFGGGIQRVLAGTTQYGTPVRTVDLGITHVPQELFEEYLQEISPRYTAETYNLLHHNCNNFSNEVAQFLVGATIPDYILQLPNEVMNSPMGPMILPMIKQLETTMRAGSIPQAPQFRPAAVAQSAQIATRASAGDAPANKAEENLSKTGTLRTETGNVLDKLPVTSDNVASSLQPEEMPEKKMNDPLGEARSRVQEEICKEFAAIMASGKLRASEAAALATRRVMERHGQLNATVPQG